mmetsp:Transcript_101966/g.285819  ORF Transcript_101966/g.285819 Transcript_101966/m.285819 type:complete len:303 (-) Transcript_101966:869-1777(-)
MRRRLRKLLGLLGDSARRLPRLARGGAGGARVGRCRRPLALRAERRASSSPPRARAPPQRRQRYGGTGGDRVHPRHRRRRQPPIRLRPPLGRGRGVDGHGPQPHGVRLRAAVQLGRRRLRADERLLARGDGARAEGALRGHQSQLRPLHLWHRRPRHGPLRHSPRAEARRGPEDHLARVAGFEGGARTWLGHAPRLLRVLPAEDAQQRRRGDVHVVVGAEVQGAARPHFRPQEPHRAGHGQGVPLVGEHADRPRAPAARLLPHASLRAEHARRRRAACRRGAASPIAWGQARGAAAQLPAGF